MKNETKITVFWNFFWQKKVIIPFLPQHGNFSMSEKVVIKLPKTGETMGEVLEIEKSFSGKISEEFENIKIVRTANKQDLENFSKNSKDSKKFLDQFASFAQESNLPIFPLFCEVSLDNKVIFCAFYSEQRIDFRDFLKNFSQKIGKRVVLRHLWSRDRAQSIGGIGVCGQLLCCQRFFSDIPSVNMEAARVQNLLHQGVEKLSGICGKLKCCLNFEKSNYKKTAKDLPKIGKTLKIKGVKGKIIGQNILQKLVKVRLESGETKMLTTEEVKNYS